MACHRCPNSITTPPCDDVSAIRSPAESMRNGPRIAFHRACVLFLHGAESRRFAARVKAQQRDRLRRIAFPLQGEGDRSVGRQGQVADRILVQRRGPVSPAPTRLRRARDRSGSAPSCRGSASCGPGDRCGCHHWRRRGSVWQPLHVMRPDPARGDLVQPRIALRAVPDAQPAFARLGHHFRGVEEPPVRRKGAVPVELSPLGRSQPRQRFAARRNRSRWQMCPGDGRRPRLRAARDAQPRHARARARASGTGFRLRRSARAASTDRPHPSQPRGRPGLPAPAHPIRGSDVASKSRENAPTCRHLNPHRLR